MTPDQEAQFRAAVLDGRDVWLYGHHYRPARTRAYRLRRWLAERIAP